MRSGYKVAVDPLTTHERNSQGMIIDIGEDYQETSIFRSRRQKSGQTTQPFGGSQMIIHQATCGGCECFAADLFYHIVVSDKKVMNIKRKQEICER